MSRGGNWLRERMSRGSRVQAVLEILRAGILQNPDRERRGPYTYTYCRHCRAVQPCSSAQFEDQTAVCGRFDEPYCTPHRPLRIRKSRRCIMHIMMPFRLDVYIRVRARALPRIKISCGQNERRKTEHRTSKTETRSPALRMRTYCHAWP